MPRHHDRDRCGHNDAMKTWMKWAIAALVVAVLALLVGPFVYINFIKDDPPDRFSLDDSPPTLDSSATSALPSTTSVGDAAPDPEQEPTEATAAATTDADGRWIIGAGSAVGYRVVEVLFGQDTEGVGRTDQITGAVTIAGTQVTDAAFEVDMTTVVSDEQRRDRQFNGRLLDTATFPTSTFVLSAPIELGAVPPDGAPITATATGDLTLRGVTKPVTFDVQAQKSGAAVQIVGSTDIVFADYGIPNPSAPGITTQDHGLLEFDLQLGRE
jgi:polyisoprenoid-binding protein YceI